jgi:site-specific DNA-methyltransferase (adenine-specific)
MNLSDKITITNEDNMALMSRYPDGYFELAIVDPPYGISVNMNAGRKKITKSKKRSVKQWDNETPNQNYFNELFRVSKNQIVWGANYMTQFLPNSMGWIFWDKCVAEGCSFSDGELAWTSNQQSLKKAVIPYSGFIGMEGEKFHPTTKPIKLYKWILDKYAKQGDKILDTHLGSGSIAIACHDYDFELTACELDSEYYDNAIKRIKSHMAQQKLF